jgi:hypothetical protein
MAQPDFSEFTFGYGVTRYFEELYNARRVLPTFPTQNEEADGGYDVDFVAHGVPLFIQFKRSEVITRRSAMEYKQHPGDWAKPTYRMHLHGHNAYRQHYLMQDLEDKGNMAIYVTSQVSSKAMLNQYYGRNRVIDAAKILLPSEIVLPNVHERHHVAFNRSHPGHRVYSESGEYRESRIADEKDLRALLREQAGRKSETRQDGLELFVAELARLTPDGVAQQQRQRRPVKSEVKSSVGDDELNGRFDDALFGVSEVQRSITSRLFYERLQGIESVARRAAIAAYHEVDAHLVIVPSSALG